MKSFLLPVLGILICVALGCGSEFENGGFASLQSSQTAREAEQNELTVFFVSPNQIQLLDADGDELWQFRCDNGEFFRDNSNESRYSATDELLFLSTTTSIVAVEIASGELLWSFDYPKPSELATCSEVVAAGDRVLVSVNQIGAPMACLDTTNGELLWSFPSADSEEQMSFQSITVKDGIVLCHATIYRKDSRGYDYENRAIDIRTGEQVEWPDGLTAIPEHVSAREIGVFFGDAALAPVQDGELFTGVLSFSRTHQYHFDRPSFHADQPLYRFDIGEGEYEDLLGRKVQIRGEAISIQESAPPIITVKVLEIIALEEGHEDASGN
ncbi:MAG: PQQ-binding-like beta-propeller repeat protein [Planctomycetota bacterium]